MSKRKEKGGGQAAIYAMVTDAIIARLDAGTIPWRKPWEGAGDGVQANVVTKRAYRGVNQLLLGSLPFDQPWWLSMKQANEWGGAVRKGERSTPVVFWKRMERVVREGEKLPPGARTFTGDDGRLRTQWFMLRYFRVFNVEQVDGIDERVPEADTDAPLDGASFLHDILLDYCETDGVRLLKPGGDHAVYNVGRDTIRVPTLAAFERRCLGPMEATAAHAHAFSHECVHSTGHKTRLDRDLIGIPGSSAYAREELVAELGAAMLCARFGVSSEGILDNAASYIDHWRRRLADDTRLVVSAASRAQAAAEWIAPLHYEGHASGDVADAEPDAQAAADAPAGVGR